MSLPNIKHATVSYTQYGSIAITTADGYVFYDREAYAAFVDDDGNYRQPLPDEIYYLDYMVFPRSVTNKEIESRIVVVSPTGEIVPELEADEISAEEFMALVEEEL